MGYPDRVKKEKEYAHKCYIKCIMNGLVDEGPDDYLAPAQTVVLSTDIFNKLPPVLFLSRTIRIGTTSAEHNRS